MPLRLTRRAGSPFWWVAGTIDGCRVRESTRTDRRAAAEEYRAKREADLYRAALHGAPAQRVTFAAAVVSYAEAEPRTPATLLRVRRLLKHWGPNLAVDEVNIERLDAAAKALLRPGFKPATKRREIVTPALAIVTHAALRRWCPPLLVEPTRTSPARTAWLRPAEADRLIASAAPHLQPLIAFLLATGARMSEALSLDWADVDLPYARAVFSKTKNGRERILDLCPRAVAALANLPHRDGRVFRGRSRGKGGTILGRPYASKARQGGGQIKTGWATACKRAAVPSITPHGCRHTWATWHYAVHKDLVRLREDGGWQTASQVERYAKLAPPTLAPEILAWRGETGTPLPHSSGRSAKNNAKSAA